MAMNKVRSILSASLLAAIFVCAAALAAETAVSYKLSKIDEAYNWISPYWGYNAPKLVYDGAAFYTTAHWGKDEAGSTAVLYKYQNGKWSKGFQWLVNYQPPMLVLDSHKRIIVISPQTQGLKIFRSAAKGDIENLEAVTVKAVRRAARGEHPHRGAVVPRIQHVEFRPPGLFEQSSLP
jgi:hypothetical protein